MTGSLRHVTRLDKPTSLRARQHGQSITEFAIIVPILLVIFVAIADFGRVFATGIAIEAATRDAAEATANEYLANPPGGDLSLAATGSNQTYYDNLRAYGARVVCAELRSLPNTAYDAGSQTCPDMPVVFVCVHDGADGGCGAKASPGGAVPAQCGDMTKTNVQTTNPDGVTHPRTVEVSACYHFTSLISFAIPFFQTTLLSFGDIWLQRTRSFAIPCYFVLGTDECG